MRSNIITAILFSAIAFMIGSSTNTSKGVPQANLADGEQPYTPTRIEWLETYINANYAELFERLDDRDPSVWLKTSRGSRPNSITIHVRVTNTAYTSDLSTRMRINSQVKGIYQTIVGIARDKGWDGWLIVKDEYGS